MARLRDHTFLGTTQSLCPECLALVPAKIIAKGPRVYFRKRCPTHGVREDFICSDVALYDQMQYSLPGKVPPEFGVEPDKGCPYDCGLCTEHEQHTCIGLVEVTSSCNLRCPMCYASSGPGGSHLSFEECVRSIDRLVEVEGRAEVLQLSGGEPTIHPDFLRILDYAVAQPIDIVMVNTNGIRLAHDERMLDAIAGHAPRVEVYLQFDGFDDRGSVDAPGRAAGRDQAEGGRGPGRSRDQDVAGLHAPAGGERPRDRRDRPVRGRAALGHRHQLPAGHLLRPARPARGAGAADHLPRRDPGHRRADRRDLPRGRLHAPALRPPNCHSLTYAFRSGGEVIPLMRFIDARKHLDILANGILFSRNAARKLIEQYLDRVGGCGIGCFPEGDGDGRTADPTEAAASEFFARAVAEQLSQADVFRITITSFLDAYNFDVRRLMKCCIHHVLPSGHVIPFCAYNVLYREGHAALPALREAGVVAEPVTISAGP